MIEKNDIEPIATFEIWNQAIMSGKPANVRDEYAEGAILLPTVSGEIRTTPDRIEDYFVSFLTRQNLTGKITSIDQHFAINEELTLIHGKYIFSWTEDENAVDVEAYYTYAYKKDGDQIKIVHHHSSVDAANDLDIDVKALTYSQALGDDYQLMSGNVEHAGENYRATVLKKNSDEVVFKHISKIPQ